MDTFQDRYIKHQAHKKCQFQSAYGQDFKPLPKIMKNHYYKLLKSRRSQRIFNKEEISKKELEHILDCMSLSPSSCNRQAISYRVIESRDDKEILTGILVGGVGWCHRAQKIVLLMANEDAYKENFPPMPYLDAGVVVMNAYLACESMNIGCCFINPNIRKHNKQLFEERFGDQLFCGALAIGKYDKKAEFTEKAGFKDLLCS